MPRGKQGFRPYFKAVEILREKAFTFTLYNAKIMVAA